MTTRKKAEAPQEETTTLLDFNPTGSLASKIAVIAERIGDREAKKKPGAGVSFAFHAAKDVYGWWRPLLTAARIILVPRILSHSMEKVTLPRSGGGERVTFITLVEVEFTLIDGITNERIVGSAIAQGEDPTDKGAGKAMTYAEKIFLLGMGMNGAESDNEESPHADYDGMVTESSRDVRVGESNIQGVQRGGRQTNATQAQVQKVRVLARELSIDARGVARVVKNVLGDDVELPEEGAGDPGPVLVAYLGTLKADALGKLIERLEDAKKTPAQRDAEDKKAQADIESATVVADETINNQALEGLTEEDAERVAKAAAAMFVGDAD